MNTCSRPRIPQLDLLIAAAAGNQISLMPERNRPHATRMSLQRIDAFATAKIPQTYGVIVASTGRHRAIRSEGDRAHTISVTIKCFEALRGSGIPEPHQ